MARHAVGGGASGHGGACGGRWGERARRGAGRGWCAAKRRRSPVRNSIPYSQHA